MRLVEAIKSNLPFRRPSWIEENDEFKWVILSSEDTYFDWCKEDGIPSGNVFGSLEDIARDNPDDPEDYEVFK